MTKMFADLNEVKEAAIAISTSIRVSWPQNKSETDYVPNFNSEQDKHYGINNGVVSFIQDRVQYVIPAMSSVVEILRDNGFEYDNYIYVPFSNWEHPTYEGQKWEALWQMRRGDERADFLERCYHYSIGRGLREIDSNLLNKCFRMPENGVNVKHSYFTGTYYPVVTGSNFDDNVISNIGHYCTNNGTMVFVYLDTETYVTRDIGVMNALMESGFTEAGMFVPFSNGEEITDPSYAANWERCLPNS